MKKLLLQFFAIISAIIFINCGGSQPATNLDEVDVPDWYLNSPEQDENYIYATSTAVSKDLQMAVDKASLDARAEIGQIIQVRLGDIGKRFSDEVGIDDNSNINAHFSETIKSVVSTELSGSQIVKKDIGKENDVYRAYVLAKYPIGEASEIFLKMLAKQKDTYTRFLSSQAYQELDREIDKYEEFKKTQK